MNKHSHPPVWADRLLEWFCSDDQLEILQGDLYELYETRLKHMSLWKANFLFIKDVIDMLRPFALRRRNSKYNINNVDMIANYWKVGWRNLFKEKVFTAINITSLTLAITCLSFIYIYLKQEMAYDHFHDKKDRIFRISRITNDRDGTITEKDTSLPEPLGRAVADDYPQVDKVVRMLPTQRTLKLGDRLFNEDVIYADPTFFDVFSFKLSIGNKKTALGNNHNVVLSDQLAKKIFPEDQDLLGKSIEIRLNNEYREFTISGVTEELPSASSIPFDVLLPLDQFLTDNPFGESTRDDWYSSFLITYLLLNNSSDFDYLDSQMDDFRLKYYPETISRMIENGLWEDETNMPITYGLQNITSVHTDTSYRSGVIPSVNPQKYYILGGIAIFVLILGCINFTLLSVGKSGRRSLEIGMRKAVGANRKQIILQFWSESMLTSILSTMLALLMVYLLLPTFNKLTQAQLVFHQFVTVENLLVLLGITAFTGTLASCYPTIVVSAFKPIGAIQNKIRNGTSSWFTKSLIVFQFAISTFFVIGALILFQQLSFFKNYDLGISKEGIAVLSTNEVESQDVETFKTLISRHSFVDQVTGVRFRLPLYANSGWTYNGNRHKAYVLAVDRNFMKTLEMDLIEGADFSPSVADSTNSFVVNEAFVKQMGWEEPIGKRVLGYNRRGLNEPEVIGVVKNFHFQSLENEIKPMIITINPREPFTSLMIKMNTSRLADNIDMLKKDWKTLFPETSFDHSFLKDDLNSEYQAEERWGKVLKTASFINILIACLGLFGFSTLYISGRLKEISIRKVMGGSSFSIFGRFCAEFAKLIVISCFIAIPIAWYVMQDWLTGFAYRIHQSWVVYLIAIAAIFFFALIAVSHQWLKTRNANPAIVLKES